MTELNILDWAKSLIIKEKDRSFMFYNVNKYACSLRHSYNLSCRKEHVGQDKNSHMLQHSLETGHARVDINNIEILYKNFTNYYKRKISETLYLKSIKAVLNIHDNSFTTF